MKRRLFWKILFAFWLTFLAITQGVWLWIELSRQGAGAPPLMASTVGLEAVAALVEKSGPAGFDALLDRLPEEQRKRVELVPVGHSGSTQEQGNGGDAGAEMPLTINAVGPDKQGYEVRYRPPPRGWAGIPLNAPPELLILGLLGGFLFSAALAWYLTEPINRLRIGFDRLARGDLGIRLKGAIGKRRDEIADLARDFDITAERVEQLVAARDRLLHDVSHELRSPLARLQLAIGLARQMPARTEMSLDRIDREAKRLDILVGELLALTRAESTEAARDEYFDLADVVESVVEDARFEAQASQVSIELLRRIPAEDERPPIQGDAGLMRKAIDNIVRNALRFSGQSQTVHVTILYLREEQIYQIDVTDEGPGVPSGEIGEIFEPFIRGTGSGDGLGLGLAIASRAVLAHRGTIAARNRVPKGLEIAVRIPVLQRSRAD